MADWLKQNFLRVGILALAVDLFSRLYVEVILDWLARTAGERGATFADTVVYVHLGTALDLLATLLWGLFAIGFAIRVVAGLQDMGR